MEAEELQELNKKVPVLRQAFRDQFAESIKSGVYHDKDLERLEVEDGVCRRFLLHQKKNVERASAMVDTSFRWRKEIGVNDLTEKSFPREFHELGGVYFHNVDKEGHRILYFHVSKHKKDPDKLFLQKQYIAWWFDKHFQKTPEETIVVFFDMQGAGITNMDLDLVRFQISCFATYFPAILAYALIYEMPWVLNAIWKLIKQLLSEEQQKFIIFAKKADLQKYFDPDQLWVHMGGTDTYQYQYLPSEDSGIDVNGDAASLDSLDALSADAAQGAGVRKRVTFAESQYTSFDGGDSEAGSATAKSPQRSGSSSPVPATEKPSVFKGSILHLSPAEQFSFSLTDESVEVPDVLTLTNVSPKPVAYKVKTTTPDNYRVRTSTGMIKPGQSVEVYVYLQPGCGDSVKRDKFLVLGMQVEDASVKSAALAALWKAATKNPASYMEHRLWCSVNYVEAEAKTDAELIFDKLDDIQKQMRCVVSRQERLEASIRRALLVLSFIGLLLLLVAGLALLHYDSPASVCANTNAWKQ